MNTIKTVSLVLLAVVLIMSGVAKFAKPTLSVQYEQSQLKQQAIAADKAAGFTSSISK